VTDTGPPRFTEAEIAVLEFKRHQTVSQWSAKHRILTPSMTAEPGPWRNNRTPYLREIMDSMSQRGIEEVVFVKPAQIGGSEAARNCLGYWIDHDPGPCMVVMPDEQSSREAIKERIKPLIVGTPRLKRHLSGKAWDTTRTTIHLATMPLYAAWAGSPQRLATRPVRYLIFDEIDKYPRFSGREADPVRLGLERTTTYGHRRRILKISTPTVRTGNIWMAWEACPDKRYYLVPCPACGVYQRLIFDRLKWPKTDADSLVEHAERIDMGDLAWYECESCEAHLRDNDKPSILNRGVWCGQDQAVGEDGKVRGDRVRSRTVGFHLSSLYSPWVRFSALAAEFLRSKDDAAALMNFRNSKLAEPFEERASSTKPGTIADKAKHAGRPLVVPTWAGAVLASADVQKDTIYYVIRAWGAKARSQLVDYGKVQTFTQLGELLFERQLPIDDSKATEMVMAVAIDSRYRTDEVFAFAQKDPQRIRPIAGAAQIKAPPIREHNIRGYEGVVRRTINPNYWKGILHALIHNQDETHWLPHAKIENDYCRHMSSEHYIFEPKQGAYIWALVSSGGQNHWWDCEVYQCVLAQTLGVDSIPEESELRKRRHPQPENRPPPKPTNWATSYKGAWS
jgi:phage terminase large subunit GpA-like protein